MRLQARGTVGFRLELRLEVCSSRFGGQQRITYLKGTHNPSRGTDFEMVNSYDSGEDPDKYAHRKSENLFMRH